MTRTYDVIDSDGHILEPADLWINYIDPKFREQAPRLVPNAEGREMVSMAGQIFGPSPGMGSAGAIGFTQEQAMNMKYAQGRAGGFDPHERIKDLDLDGIDAVFLYPSVGLLLGAVKDPEFVAASSRAYNRWIADYCKPYPDRLFGVAMLPLQSIDLAIEELRFARNVLGMRAAFVRPNPYNNRLLCDRAYDRLWAVAQELDMAIGVHEASSDMKETGVDRVEGYAARHIVSHAMEMQLATMNIIWGGVCERFPRLRFGFLECGGGWMIGWLDRMDRHFDRRYKFDARDHANLKMRPSEYFRRQCWISFEPVERTIAWSAGVLGAEKILWATDYPHSDGYFPGAPQMVANQLPDSMRQQVMAQGAIDFYGLN